MLPIGFYWTLLLRRLPLMAAMVMICSCIALYAALTLPPFFTATARLQVEAPQIPDDMVASLVRTEAAEQLQLIQEQLMTRANLLEVARKYRVFLDMEEMTPDSIVTAMQENTKIRRSSGRDQATLMSITFTARRGQIAANVVNDYTTLVLEENASSRRERAENTLSFFQQETARLADEIDEQSNRIIAFKNENVDALPDELAYRQARQATLQERLGRLEQERASVVTQRSEMLALFEATGRLDTAAENLTPEQRRLEDLQQQLNAALTIYSETNPRVVLLRSQIDKLNSSLATLSAAEGQGDDAPVQGNSIIDITLAEMDQRAGQIDQEIIRVNEELESLGLAIAATATNSITLERLERDLESIRSRYNGTLGNLNQARMAERVEVNAQGQRITLIEGAVVPEEPAGPSRKKIVVAGVGGGIMLAAGIFVLFELLNQKLRHPNEIQSRFNIVPIGVIPYMETRREKMRRRAIMLGGPLAVIVLVPVGLYFVHTQFMPLEVLANQILIRLGLV
ncbi:MAG: chain length-determining protein [Roseobacter sp.]